MRVIPFLLGLALAVTALPVTAQDDFSPVITVNGRAITGYELGQRLAFLDLLRVPGDHVVEAERGLIEDRLRMEAAERAGVSVSQEQLTAGMSEFAARANLELPQFLEAIGQGGIAPETYRDFVEAGLLWREVVRARFGPRIVVTDADIARAMSVEQGRGAGPRIKVSEIFLPTSPTTFADQRDLAEELAKTMASGGAFAEAARKHSAAPSRDAGGDIGWIPVTNLPAQMRPFVMGMQPGQVSPPVQIGNALVLVRLQAKDEGGPVSDANLMLDYTQYLIPGAGTAEAQSEAQRVRDDAQTCGELHALARRLPAERLVLTTQPLAQVPGDLAPVLAGLDENETAVLTRGGTTVVVMLCDRNAVTASLAPALTVPVRAAAPAGAAPVDGTVAVAETTGDAPPRIDAALTLGRGPSTETLRAELTDQRLNALAISYLAELRASAVINRP